MKSIGAVLFVVFFLYGSLNAAERITIGVPALSATYTTAYVAEDKGFFKQEGLEAAIVLMRSTVTMPALINEELDYTMLLGSIVRAALRGVPVRLVASYLDGPTLRVVSKPEIRSVEGLKGKKIGINVVGDQPHLIARMIVKRFGLDPEKDVEYLPIGRAQAQMAALRQGIVDAILVAPPGDFKMKKLGYNRLAVAYDFMRFPWSGLATATSKIKKERDEVKRVIRATIRANRYIRENREGTIEVMMKWVKVDREVASDIYESMGKIFNKDGGLHPEEIQIVIDISKKRIRMKRKVALNEVSDASILKEVRRELGIKER